MRTLPIIYSLVTAGALATALSVPYLTHARGSASVPGWQGMVSPGDLSAKHQFLANTCDACHTAHRGPTSDKCIACHANDQALLGRQPTAFHAELGKGPGDCRACHVEHLGTDGRPSSMDHLALVHLGASRIALPAGLAPEALPVAHSRIRPEETVLDCSACHANQDPHRTLFGRDCAVCHATTAAQGGWTIAEFRHPSPLSTDCAQCHQAPPSHYMEHFQMVSMTVAHIEHADVSQCFLCHQTNSWNDIKGVGWYKHH